MRKLRKAINIYRFNKMIIRATIIKSRIYKLLVDRQSKPKGSSSDKKAIRMINKMHRYTEKCFKINPEYFVNEYSDYYIAYMKAHSNPSKPIYIINGYNPNKAGNVILKKELEDKGIDLSFFERKLEPIESEKPLCCIMMQYQEVLYYDDWTKTVISKIIVNENEYIEPLLEYAGFLFTNINDQPRLSR